MKEAAAQEKAAQERAVGCAAAEVGSKARQPALTADTAATATQEAAPDGAVAQAVEHEAEAAAAATEMAEAEQGRLRIHSSRHCRP